MKVAVLTNCSGVGLARTSLRSVVALRNGADLSSLHLQPEDAMQGNGNWHREFLAGAWLMGCAPPR